MQDYGPQGGALEALFRLAEGVHYPWQQGRCNGADDIRLVFSAES
jgi:hypothetical protein